MSLQVNDVVLELGDGDQKITALDHVSFSVDDGELLGAAEPGAESGGHDDESEAHVAIVGVSVRADGERDGSR